MFIKEKEYALGVDTNPRSRPFYLVDIRTYYKPHRNAETKAEDTTKSDMNALLPKSSTPAVNQWVKILTKKNKT